MIGNHQDSPLRTALDVVRRRWLLALGVFGAAFAAAASFALFLPDLYRATAVVLVDRPVAEGFVRPAVAGELESRLHVIKQETLSRDRLKTLIERFNLYPELRQNGAIEAALDRTRDDIQIELNGPEQVSGRTKTVAFKLNYTGRDRDTVAEVTNSIASFYVQQNDQMRTQEAAQTTQFLKAQLDEAKKALDREEQQVQSYNTRNVGQLPQQFELNLAALDRLNTQLRINGERQLRAIEQRGRLTDDALILESGSGGTAAEPDRSVDRLEKLKQDLKLLETQYTAKHPDVQRLRDEIARIERANAAEPPTKVAGAPAVDPAEVYSRLGRSRRQSIQSLDAEIAKLKEEETTLRASIADVERRLESIPARQQEFSMVSRDRQSAKDLYDSLLKRYEEAQIAESMETDRRGERFRIVEAAVAPEGPSAPNRAYLLVLGVLAAIALAAVAVVIAEQFDTTFHSLDELKAFTSVPVLATIPVISISRGRQVARAALVSVSILLVVGLTATAAAYLARGNEDIVRLLVRS
ncbi:MAG TPA: GNVR domain-containing protein [Vicinamibacterales bacterium]|nr:GNVR domain-containing protein [Vicinamibacterales bacterium]